MTSFSRRTMQYGRKQWVQWTGCGLDNQKLWCDSSSKRYLSSPNCPTWPWGPPIHLFNRYRCSSPGMQQPAWNLTAHIHLVLKLQMHRTIPPHPNTPSWCGDPLLCAVLCYSVFMVQPGSSCNRGHSVTPNLWVGMTNAVPSHPLVDILQYDLGWQVRGAHC